ncbi:hypothetical protein [Pseudoalteromonas sp. OOF1S-7]|uniref:hypothetical protein n=1 Tax=Pseudoalteromonas sp. OOF1S-7 TaxID=2917757 RepID=UPI001EF42E18|nr:hypothetical protein [Pseudoalteromonas sp. OOF1S-7]MCG7537397.1 hypothetical protein [Pseudoalteromonas sp. OOF1S-7]
MKIDSTFFRSHLIGILIWGVIASIIGGYIYDLLRYKPKLLVECNENDLCQGTPVMCKVAHDVDKKGRSQISKDIEWLHGPDSPENVDKKLETSAIKFGDWKNPNCGWSGKG